jgi:predicted SnoaL-like aldol condensation-catalyzing enzyme
MSFCAAVNATAHLPTYSSRTCRYINVSGIDIFRFRDGKVIEHWHEADHLEMFRQLGADVIPTAPAGS